MEDLFVGFLCLLTIFVTSPDLTCTAPTVVGVDHVVPVSSDNRKCIAVRRHVDLQEIPCVLSSQVIRFRVLPRSEVDRPKVKVALRTTEPESSKSASLEFLPIGVLDRGELLKKVSANKDANPGTLRREVGPKGNATSRCGVSSAFARGTMCFINHAEIVGVDQGGKVVSFLCL